MHRPVGRLAAAAFLAALLYAPSPARAGSASDVIRNLNGLFIGVMQKAETLGYDGRYKALEPGLTSAYDLAEMTRVAAGRHWRNLSDTQKQQLIAAFQDYSIATYAARFDGFGGERFEILDEQPAPGGATRVDNQIVLHGGEAIRIDYLLRQTQGRWRIIDVYLKSSVSELAVRRAEFTDILAKSGFDGLIALLEAKIAALQAGKAPSQE